MQYSNYSYHNNRKRNNTSTVSRNSETHLKLINLTPHLREDLWMQIIKFTKIKIIEFHNIQIKGRIMLSEEIYFKLFFPGVVLSEKEIFIAVLNYNVISIFLGWRRMTDKWTMLKQPVMPYFYWEKLDTFYQLIFKIIVS